MMKKIMKKSILAFILLIVFTLLTNQVNAGGESRAATSSASPSSHSSNISATQDNATIAMAINQNGSGNTNAQVNTLPIITSSTSSPTTISAIINGKVNPGGLNTTVWFETPTGGPYQTQNIGNGTSPVALTFYTLTGLTPSTAYTFRIVATNSLGNTYGNWTSFTTLSNSNGGGNGGGALALVPGITSTNYSGITTTGAKLEGSVKPRGYATQAWFEIQNGNSTLVQNIGNGNSSVTLAPYNLTGLAPHTTYSFRISASNQNGTANGAWTTFTTLSNSNGGGGGGGYIVSTITTENATNISTNSVKLNSTIHNSYGSTSAYFQYGTLSNLTSYTETVHINTGGINSSLAFNKVINGLTPNTTYYFRGVVKSNGGIKYGNIFSFKTLPVVIVNNNQNNPIDDIEDKSNNQIDTTKEEVTIEESNQSIENINNDFQLEEKSNLSANALYAFLPSTTSQWIILIILIIAIFFVSRKIYLNIKKEKDNKTNANHIDNLPV